MERVTISKLQALKGPILITGHTGFKGTWLTLLLEKIGVNVVGFSLAPEKNSLFERLQRAGKIVEAYADIRNYEVLGKFISETKPAAIIHLAAQPLVLESYKFPLETFSTNVMGTANLLDLSFKYDSVKVIIVVTTDKVYRNSETGETFKESDPLEGKDPYSASKVGTEAAVAAWQHIASISGGPKVVSVRAGNVIGGGDWSENRLLPDLIRSFSSGETVKIRNSESTRPWQHVLDPLSGYLLALSASLEEANLKTINFGPFTRSLKVAEVVEIAKNTWQSPVYIEFSEKVSSKSFESESLEIDPSFAKRELNWNPIWTQHEAIVSTVEWWDAVLNRDNSAFSSCLKDIEILLNSLDRR